MKTSTLACYLESIANALRTSKSADLPLIKWTAFKGPQVLHVGASNIPIPAHQDAVKALATIFPDVVAVSTTHGQTVTDRNELADVRSMLTLRDQQLRDRDILLGKNQETMDRLNRALEEAKTDALSLRQTIARMRNAGAEMIPAAPRAIVPAPVPNADLVSAILADAETPEQRDHRERIASLPPVADLPGQRGTHGVQFPAPFAPALVVVAFKLNRQGKTLTDAGVSLDELRAGFVFRFIDPKDATRGGYWVAKDPTAPSTHLMVQRLAEAGAIIGDTIPATIAHK